MTTIIAKHGKTYTLADGDQIKFGGPLKSMEGDGKPKPGRYAYRWGKAAVCYLYVPRLELVDGSTYRAAAEVPSEVPSVPAPPPPPAPGPTPPASTGLTSGLQNGNSYLQTADMTVGLNPAGGIGTSANTTPTGYRSDTANNFVRIGLYVPPLSDLVLQGRAIEGFGLMIAGKRFANMLLTGYNQIAGSFKNPVTWEGSISGVEVTQAITMSGKTIRLAVTLRNTTSAAIDLQYFRAIDPDQAGEFNTANKVVAAGVAECTVKGGKLVIRAPGADFHVTTYDKAPDIGTRREVGVSKTADEVVQAVFPRASLAAGQSVTHVVEYEVVLVRAPV